MFTQTAEYALRAVVALAQHHGEPQITARLAQMTRVPEGYLSKVLQTLARAGLVSARRGLHGGFSLTRSPEEITVLEVINAVEPFQRIEQCPLNIKDHGSNLCPLHRRLDEALAQVESTLAASRISEMLNQPGASTPLCSGETAPQPMRLGKVV
jgi:Rrf2 family protein